MYTYGKTAFQQSHGGHTNVWKFGVGCSQLGVSDFASLSGTSGTITLATLKPGDVVFPGAILDIITAASGSSATLTAQVGISGGTANQFLGATSIKSTTAKAIVGTSASAPDNTAPYVNNSGSDQTLILTLTAGSGNISDFTAGVFLLSMCISPRALREVNAA